MITDMEKFTRRLHINLHFKDKKTKDHNTPITTNNLPISDLSQFKQLKLPSTWRPPLDKLPKSERLLLCKILKLPYNIEPIPNIPINITKPQRKALRDLINNTDIIVTPADKGGTTVLLNKANYIKEALRQLNDNKYYKLLLAPLTTNNHDSIRAILKNMLRKKQITSKQFLFFLPQPHLVKPRKFYLLPKIHKPIEKWLDSQTPPGRPIVSDVNSESYNIGKLITALMAPYPPTLPSFVKNSTCFKDRVAFQTVPTGTILVTADIDSLYTNMDPDRCIVLTRQYLLTLYNTDLTDNIIQLLRISLHNNDFLFNNDCYLQTFGVAMGKSFAPHLANIYLAPFDDAACNGFPYKPLMYTRYIDDIFFAWPHGLSTLTEFQTYLNRLIPGIKLTFSTNDNSVDFLDTSIFISDHTLLTKVYFKPTDRHSLLAKTSFHPHHTHKGILKSQFIRFKNLSCTYDHYIKTCDTLIYSLLNRGYKAKRMRCLANFIWHKYQPKAKIDTTNVIFLPLTYNKTNQMLADHIKTILLDNPTTATLRPVVAWRANRNLRQQLRNYP